MFVLGLVLSACGGSKSEGETAKESFDTLSLQIPMESQTILDSYIADAEKREIIPDKDKEYVDAFINSPAGEIAIKIRLKGDWTDHLKYGNPSYRIKIKDDYAFHGLKSFSIQHPKTRHFAYEWLIHKMAENEDVLCTTYEFLNIQRNDTNYGFYALEEHFTKQLLESRGRREGPILKLDESGAWELLEIGLPLVQNVEFPCFESSRIDAFQKNKIKKSAGLSKQFSEGGRLLELFKNGHLKLDDIFDVENLARYYVLMELSASSHGLRWHNRRFYFNPITQKLEHILFDVVPYSDRNDHFKSIIETKLLSGKSERLYNFDHAVLLNREFKKAYLDLLKEKTKESYLDAVFAEFDPELTELNAIFQLDEFEHKFERAFFYEHFEYLRNGITRLDSLWEVKLSTVETLDSWIKKPDYKPREDQLFAASISLNMYCDKTDSTNRVFIENYHPNEITLLAYKVKGADAPVLLEKPIVVPGFNDAFGAIDFTMNKRPKKFYFTATNSPDIIHSRKVVSRPKPQGATTRMELEQQFTVSSAYYQVLNNEVVFAGDLIIDSLLYIPKRYNVIIEPGSTIEFKTGGGIIAGSFKALGTELQPIHLFCADSTSNGVTILNGDAAVLSYCMFEGLSNLNYKNWELTGAVTIYETPASIENCTIKGNQSEDALNIIRSDFSILALKISDTHSDGFDADFCTGSIQNSTFTNTGNDCIDFSGSTVLIEDIEIRNSGDKGISGGEASVLTLNNIQVDGAVTGVAAKDGSIITGSKISLNNVEYATAAFRKKPEYQGAKINLVEVEIKIVQEKILVELESSVTINGEETIGTIKLDIDKLYERFQ